MVLVTSRLGQTRADNNKTVLTDAGSSEASDVQITKKSQTNLGFCPNIVEENDNELLWLCHVIDPFCP